MAWQPSFQPGIRRKIVGPEVADLFKLSLTPFAVLWLVPMSKANTPGPSGKEVGISYNFGVIQ